jgi:hypothetical protein
VIARIFVSRNFLLPFSLQFYHGGNVMAKRRVMTAMPSGALQQIASASTVKWKQNIPRQSAATRPR